MSEIDRKRVAAVKFLEEAGMKWLDGKWNDTEIPANHVRCLIECYTVDDGETGFRVTSGPYSYNRWSQDAMLKAWEALREAMGYKV